MTDHPTLVKPPPLDPSKSPIENVLELTELAAIGPNMFTNTRPLWHPPGARGIYGGAVIAQCLSAAQRTVPSNFSVHSMHCYFVLAGDSEIPVMFYVEHVRSGRSFATRTVQARQRGKCIFTTTMSFVREDSGGKKVVKHTIPIPQNIELPIEETKEEEEENDSPFVFHRIESLNPDSDNPHEKKTRQWAKARGRISPEGGHQAHLSALAYMSDSWFIGTVARIHDVWRLGEDERDLTNRLQKPEVSMMVSLDHTIYFHEPRRFRADEWMFSEMASPWSGDGRGVVTQHIHARDGTMIATCIQEGVVRLKQDRPAKAHL